MQVTFLTDNEVADVIECSDNLNRILERKEVSGAIVYRIQNPTGECVVINSPFGSYMISHGDHTGTKHTSLPLNKNHNGLTDHSHAFRYC